ncbi:MAG: holo-ACP synthase [Actinomycetales bacterium]
MFDSLSGRSHRASRPGVGVDAVEPTRLGGILERHPEVRTDLFTPVELAYCGTQPDPLQCLAARYAAKEAVVKALRLDGFDPQDISLVPTETAPRVELAGDAARRAEELGVVVEASLTHLPSVAIAVALLVPRDRLGAGRLPALARTWRGRQKRDSSSRVR